MQVFNFNRNCVPTADRFKRLIALSDNNKPIESSVTCLSRQFYIIFNEIYIHSTVILFRNVLISMIIYSNNKTAFGNNLLFKSRSNCSDCCFQISSEICSDHGGFL